MTRAIMRALMALTLVIMILSMAGCGAKSAYPTYWVDGSRGCKEDAHDVQLWSAPGAANADAYVVGAVPHGTTFSPQEVTSAFGVRYYRTAWDGQYGWLPGNYINKYEPICE